MRGSFWHSLSARFPARWPFALRGASLCALCAACVIASGCSLALPSGSPGASSPPTPIDTIPACAAVRQSIAASFETPAPEVGAGRHQVYQLVQVGPLPRQLVWRPGATMQFVWCAVPHGTTADARAQPERLTALVIGPFVSRSAAEQAQQQFGPIYPATGASVGPVVASAPALEADTWTYADKSSTLRLPSTLAAGFYLSYAQVEALPSPGSLGGGGGSGGSIFEVRPD